jgi:endonuclease YncB( thermonuclease family)
VTGPDRSSKTRVGAQPGRNRGRARPAAVGLLVSIVLGGFAAWLNWRPSVPAVEASALPLSITGRVATVEDGDTLVVAASGRLPGGARQVRVRLHAVDAPELVQSFGWAAREALAELVRRQDLRLDCYKRDARGRAVCRVRLHNGGNDTADVELELLRLGLAWHYRAFADEQVLNERLAYAAAESKARAARRGLWQQSTPLAPWDCRERLRTAGACD